MWFSKEYSLRYHFQWIYGNKMGHFRVKNGRISLRKHYTFNTNNVVIWIKPFCLLLFDLRLNFMLTTLFSYVYCSLSVFTLLFIWFNSPYFHFEKSPVAYYWLDRTMMLSNCNYWWNANFRVCMRINFHRIAAEKHSYGIDSKLQQFLWVCLANRRWNWPVSAMVWWTVHLLATIPARSYCLIRVSEYRLTNTAP